MSSYWLEALVGQELVRGSEKVETSSCEGKHVALYFSAHWCPPCKQFTPMLAELYKKLQPSGTGLEIVYVSLDKTPDEFKVRPHCYLRREHSHTHADLSHSH